MHCNINIKLNAFNNKFLVMSTDLLPSLQNDFDSNKWPKYCDYHKFFLIEEIALESDFRELHYGKCAVIGRLNLINGEIELENVRLNNLPCEYTLLVGDVFIRLLCGNYHGETLQNGCFYMVQGEVVLLNRELPKANHTPLTVRGIHEQLGRLLNADTHFKYLEHLQSTYRPAIKVLFVNQIDLADELIERYLEIRALCERKPATATKK